MTRVLGTVSKHAVLIAASFVAIFPVYVMVTAAFKTQSQFLDNPYGLPLEPSLDGFRTAIEGGFPSWLVSSLILTVGSVTLTLATAAMAAWAFARWDFPGRNALLIIIISLMVIPPVVLLIPLFLFGIELGWISTYRLVIILYVGFMLPFSIFLLTAFFRTIPQSLIDAATVDGASSVGVFTRIVLPLSGAPLMTLAVVNMLWAWNELLIALVFLQTESTKTLMVGITGFQSRHSLNVPVIMAGLTLTTLPIVAMYIFGQRYFIRGLVTGSMQGE